MRLKLVSAALLLSCLDAASSFEIWGHGSYPGRVKAGGSALLKCQADGYFEYCTWKKGARKRVQMVMLFPAPALMADGSLQVPVRVEEEDGAGGEAGVRQRPLGKVGIFRIMYTN